MSIRQRCLIYALLVAPLAWLLGGILWRGDALSFRDIAHYYRPLWEWTTSQWAAGNVPLWCPLDGLGMPIHADPTASLFYPGQLIFALPVDFTTRVNLYIIGHLLLAVVLLYRAARSFGASHIGAAAGAISYAYGGHVLFQYCNPIYLVGAAWLPLAALAAHRMLTLRSYRWAIGLAVVLALMVLGGDPQLAGHVLLITAIYALLLWREERRAHNVTRVDLVQSRPLLLGVGAGVAFLLAAIQILPAMQWSSRSERAIYDRPRSVWEAITFASQVQRGVRDVEVSVASDTIAGMFATPLENSHHASVYDFSVGPWRWLEFIWPNIGGRMFPEHRRWMNAIPAEGRIWTPSLYMGLLPLLAACSVFSLRRKSDVTTRWFSWLVLFGLIGSLGVYGLGFVWHEISCGILGGDPEQRALGAPVGGLYWLLVTFVPSYVQFRYPAKLMVLASLGLALLAARGWDNMSAGPRWTRWISLALLALSLLAVVVVGLSPGHWSWLDQAVPSEYPFGGFDAAGCRWDVLLALAHTSAVAIGWLACTFCSSRYRVAGPLLLLLLTAVELSLAQHWMIASAPESALAVNSPLREEWTPPHSLRTCYRGAWHNPQHPHQPFREPFSHEKLLAWERQSLAERFHLSEGVRKLDATTALAPADLSAALLVAKQHARGDTEPTNAWLGDMGINWQLAPAADDAGYWVDVRSDRTLADRTAPKVFTPRSVHSLPELQVVSPATLAQRSHDIFFPQGTAAPLLEAAVVELPPGESWTGQFDVPRRGIVRHGLLEVAPNQYQVQVDPTTEHLLVVAIAYDSDWVATSRDSSGQPLPLTIYRTNRLQCGVKLAPGIQTVQFVYRPRMFYIGAVISGIAWSVVLLASLWLPRWRRLAATSSGKIDNPSSNRKN